MNNQLEEFKSKHPYLTEEDIGVVIDGLQVVQLNAGDIYIDSGEITYRTGTVVAGLLRIYHPTKNDEEKTTVFRKEGESVGSYPSMFKDKPSLETVVAVEDSVLLETDFRNIRENAKQNINIAQMYISILEESMMYSISRLDNYTLRSPEERYEWLLMHDPDLVARVQQQHLASYIGVTPISFSRIKKRFQDKPINKG